MGSASNSMACYDTPPSSFAAHCASQMQTNQATHTNTAPDSRTEKFLCNFWKNTHRQVCSEDTTIASSASLMLFSECSAPKLQDVDIIAGPNIMLDFPVSKGRFFSTKTSSVCTPWRQILLTFQLRWLICGRTMKTV